MTQATIEEVYHTYTDEIVCPHCGHEFTDSWELNGGGESDWQDECRECGKAILVSRHIVVKYSTLIPNSP